MSYRTGFVAALMTLAASSAAADVVELTTERVMVFKDGYALVVKTVDGVTDAAGRLVVDQVPEAAVLGSFWALADGGRVLAMTAEQVSSAETGEAPRRCRHHADLLAANRGRRCRLTLADGTTVDGVVADLLGPTDATDGGAATIVVMATGGGDVALPIGDVRRVTADDLAVEESVAWTRTTTRKRLVISLGDAGRRQRVHLMYFSPGLRWIPTYRLDLAGETAERGELSLQGEILNELEDLVAVPVTLVVGVPNFRFRAVVSPLALERELRNALLEAAPSLAARADHLSNAMFSQQLAQWDGQPPAAAGGEDGPPAVPAELTEGRSQDLFTFELGPLSLARGARAAVPVFTTATAVRHVFTWDVDLRRPDLEAAPAGAGLESPLVLSETRVWHQLELANRDQRPWTTGPVLVVADGLPLAQELLTYTSPGGSVRFPLTVAVDLRARFGEEEVGRQLDAVRWLGADYARIDKAGRLEVENRGPAAVELEITCRFGGRATEASDGGDITLHAFASDDWDGYQGHPAVNNHSELLWRTTLAPGARFAPTVAFHYFARHS